MTAPEPPTLSYGRSSVGRRRLRWVVGAITVIVAIAGVVVACRLAGARYRRLIATHAVAAWLQRARTCQVPTATLLYTERPADFPPGQWSQAGNGPKYNLFVARYPLLRDFGYTGTGDPVAYGADVLYVHEHPVWAVPAGTRPALVVVRYLGLTPPNRFNALASGQPTFNVDTIVVPPPGQLPTDRFGGRDVVGVPFARTMAHLRIFAGQPDPVDPTRFWLPFDCDGGHGRFEFQMDAGNGHGGSLTPNIVLVWEGPATTRR
jgi:hypothetical protein